MNPPDRSSTRALPGSPHFVLAPLADGVYAALATEEGAAYSNAGIVDLGDRTLVLDTFDTLQAAEDLQAAAETLTGRSASYVVISHWHGDHWAGNQLFADQATLISTPQTLEGMQSSVQEVEELIQNPLILEGVIRENEEKLRAETDALRRISLERMIRRLRDSLATLPRLVVRLPTLTFDRRLVFHGAQRRAELVAWGVGHTAGDCSLLLPDDRVAFIGDLGFFACQPYMGSCDPQAWIAQCDRLAELDVQTYVPGHGPLGTQADLALQKQYLVTLEGIVAGVVQAGGAVEEALARPLPPPFDAWLVGGLARFEANVRFLYERLSGA